MFLIRPERRSSTLLTKVLLAISIFYFFSSIFFGLDFTDSFYHLNMAVEPPDGIYLYPFFLSSIITEGLIGVVGKEIIYLRFLNSLILFFSVLIPFFFIKVKKPRDDVHLYVAICLFLFAPFNVNILGYDSFSIFILSSVFSLSVLYFHKPGLYLILLLSFTCALAVLIRLPNLIVIPIVLLFIIFIDKRRQGNIKLKLPGLFLLLTLLFIITGFASYYSNLDEFFKSTPISSAHNLKILFYNYFLHGLKLLLFIFLLLIVYFLLKKSGHSRVSYFYYAGVCLFFLIFFSLFIIRSKYSQNYSLFLTSLAVLLVGLMILQNRKYWSSNHFLVSYLFIIFLFINPFGSNTGLLKATSLFLLLPFILSYYNWKPSTFWKLFLIILIPFSIIENLSSTYEDSSILKMSSTLQVNLLKPIRTTETRDNFLDSIDSKIKELRGKNVQVYFYGNKSHIFHYLYPESSLNISSFFQPVETLVYYPLIKQKIKDQERVAIFIVDSYPKDHSSKQYKLGEKLRDDGFIKTKWGSSGYYLKMENYCKLNKKRE